MALGELHGRNLASALMRSRVHNRTSDRGGKPIQLAAVVVGLPPVLPVARGTGGAPHSYCCRDCRGAQQTYTRSARLSSTGEAITTRLVPFPKTSPPACAA